ncbi:MAG: thiamine diphosphokinase [Actinomycetes bacterium]
MVVEEPHGRPVVVLAGGDPVAPAVAVGLPADAYVVAADSGLDHAAALGLDVDLVVGDLDSVSPQRLAAARAAGVEVEEHPTAKDATDLALALDAAAARGPADVVLVGGHGGRLDHLLANALVLADDRYAHLRLTARMGPATVTVVRDRAELTGTRGELVSLLPVHGPAAGVTTVGLLYPLDGEDLAPGTTRGVSNELTGPRATVTVTDGVLLVVQPGVLGTHQLGPRT